MPALEIHNLHKQYGPITALNNFSLQVEEGNIFGILGPNGSGKTTTLGIVLGIIKANSGSYTWFDNRYGKNARKNIGALLETPNFYPFLNAEDNLDIVAHIKGVKHPKIDELLELVNLNHRRKSPFRTYSLGMKQRLAIAGALIGDPKVLIFDEPTNGLDPEGIAEVRQTIKSIGEQGKTIFMASHILDEVEKVCTHVAIIKRGNLLATGTVGAIISNEVTVELASNDNIRLRELLLQNNKLQNIKLVNNKIIGTIEEDSDAGFLNKLAFDNGILLTHLVAKQKSLESEFLEITRNKN